MEPGRRTQTHHENHARAIVITESSVVNEGKEDLKRLAVESFQIFFIHTGLIIEENSRNAVGLWTGRVVNCNPFSVLTTGVLRRNTSCSTLKGPRVNRSKLSFFALVFVQGLWLGAGWHASQHSILDLAGHAGHHCNYDDESLNNSIPQLTASESEAHCQVCDAAACPAMLALAAALPVEECATRFEVPLLHTAALQSTARSTHFSTGPPSA